MCFLNTKGQLIIQGTVSDSLNRPVNNASIHLFHCDSLTIKSFTFSNTKGAFTLEVPEQSAKWCIGISLLGYKETTVRVNQIKNNLLRVILLPSAIKELKPVIVESPKFQIKGDTLLFNVVHYDRKDFKSIGDIIRNIPGITIDEHGTIFYNGTAISNYYIEDLELLDNRYRIANDHLPKQMVEQVQIYTKHQPIKLLNPVLKTRNVAINLKLKDNAKGKLISSAAIETGRSTQQILYDLNLLNTLFSRKYQVLINTTGNNSGKDQESILTGIKLNSLDPLSDFFVKTNRVQVLFQRPSSLSNERFIRNQSVFPSINTIAKKGKDGTLKLNANFINEGVAVQQTTKSVYFITDSTIHLTEQNHFFKNRNLVSAGGNHTINSRTIYVINEINYLGYFHSFDQSNTQGLTDNSQRAVVPEETLKLKSKFISTIGKTILSGGLLYKHQKINQRLQVDPGMNPILLNNSTPYNSFLQSIQEKQHEARGFLHVINTLKKIQIQTGIEFEIKKNHFDRSIKLKSDTLLLTPSNYADAALTNVSTTINAISKFSYKFNKWDLSLNIPVGYAYMSLNTNLRTIKNTIPFINPTFGIVYNFNEFHHIEAFLSHEQTWQSDLNRIPFEYFPNYRNIFSGSFETLPVSGIRTLSLAYKFAELGKGVNLYTDYHISSTKNNLTDQFIADESVQSYKFAVLSNQTMSHKGNITLTKTLKRLRSSLSLKSSFLKSEYNQYQQNNQTNFTLSEYFFQLEGSTKFGKHLSLDYNSRLSFNNTAIGTQNIGFKKTEIRLTPTIFIFKNKIGIKNEHHYFRAKGPGNFGSYYITNLNVALFLKKKRIDLSFQNLTNQKVYYEFFSSGNLQTWNIYQLRPFQASLNYSFFF